jgi:uncharacterized protein (DUF1684 family)
MDLRVYILLGAATGLAMAEGDSGYRGGIERWRHEREAKLKADDGWLTVAGLFWLKDGANAAGSSTSNAIRLPRGPAHVGDFGFHDGKTLYRPEGDGKPAVLKADTDPGGPDKVVVGEFTMFVIHRGNRFAVRLKDKDSELRRGFTGLHWFPVREEYRIVARFVPYEQVRQIAIPNILGETEKEPSPGYAVFSLHGHEYRLDPVLEENRLFFIFRDQTSGKETYGSGRFLYAEMPKEGKVVLDFNKAENPPCAFTPYATCPLPPPQNRLAVRIEAGELNYGHH